MIQFYSLLSIIIKEMKAYSYRRQRLDYSIMKECNVVGCHNMCDGNVWLICHDHKYLIRYPDDKQIEKETGLRFKV